MPPLAGDMEGNEETEDANRALDFILEPRPSDYSNIIRRYSNYSGVVHPSNSLSRTKSAKAAPASAPSSKTPVDSVDPRTGGRQWTKKGVLKAAEAVRSAKKSPPESSKLEAVEEVHQTEHNQEKLRQLEVENAALKERVAILEAVHAEEADDLDNLARFRIRVLKAQNMHLEQEVVALAGSISAASGAKVEVLAAIKDLRQKAKELQQMPPVAEPRIQSTLTANSAASLAAPASIRSHQRTTSLQEQPPGSTRNPLNGSQKPISPALAPIATRGRPGSPLLLDNAGPNAKKALPESKLLATAKAKGQQPERDSRRDSLPGTPSQGKTAEATTPTHAKRAPLSTASSASSSPLLRGTSSFASSSRSSVFGSQELTRKNSESSATPKSTNARTASTPKTVVETSQKSTQKSSKAKDLSRAGPKPEESDASKAIVPYSVLETALHKSISEASSSHCGDARGAAMELVCGDQPQELHGCLGLRRDQGTCAAGGRVAVQVDWLSDLERLCSSLEDRLKQAEPPPRWVTTTSAVAAESSTRGSCGGVSAQAGGSSTSSSALEAGQAAAADRLTQVPFLPAAGNRFVVKGLRGDAPVGLPDNMVRILQGSLPLVQYGQVHELEGRLGDLYPRLLVLANLLSSVVLPSLPNETKAEVMKEIQSALRDVKQAARSLSELASLVPSGVRLRGFGPQSAADQLALEAAPHRDGGGGAGGGHAPHRDSGAEASQESLHGEAAADDAVSSWPSLDFPSADDIMEALPKSWANAADEAETRRCLQSLVDKVRNTEAKWRAQMSAAQNELDFYRGTHAAQAWHVGQVLSAGRFALEALLGDAFVIGAAAIESLKTILRLLDEPGTAQSVSTWRAALVQEAPALQGLTKVFPQSFSAPKAAEGYFDPLEKEFKSRMQVVFEKLQTHRASLARANSLGSQVAVAQTPSSHAQKASPPGAVTARLSGSPVGRLTGSFARAASPTRSDEKKLLRPLSFGSPQHPRQS